MRFLQSRAPSLGLVSLLLLAGCGGVSTENPNGITGTAIDTFDPGTSKTTSPVDPAVFGTIAAIVDEGGKPTTFKGSIAADGSISIPDVPEGPYWLAITRPPTANDPGAKPVTLFQRTDSRTLDLGTYYTRRKDVEAATQPTFLVVSAPLTTPWQTSVFDANGNPTQPLDDSLAFVSRSADVNGEILGQFEEGGPANGAAALSSWKIDTQPNFLGYSDGEPHLIRADKSDDFALVHRVTSQVGPASPPPGDDPWSSYTFIATKEMFRPKPFTLPDGGLLPVSGTFAAAAPKTFALDYKGSAFNALLKDAPTQALTSAFVQVSLGQEYGTPDPGDGGVAPLVDFFVFASTVWTNPTCNPAQCDAACANVCPDTFTLALPGDHTHSYDYGDPFDGGQELVTLSYGVRVLVTSLLPPSESPDRLRGGFLLQAPAGEVSGFPIVPVVSLARNVTVNGKPAPADAVTTGAGATPVIAFDAPAMGSPDQYSVVVVELDDVKGPADAVVSPYRTVFAAYLPSTLKTVTIPDGALEAGKHYYAQVSSIVTQESLSAPYRFKARRASSTTFTGVFTR